MDQRPSRPGARTKLKGMGNLTLSCFQESAAAFEVMKDEARQKIIVDLIERGPLNVGEIAAGLTLSRPAISHHLKLLQIAGLVSVEKKGTSRFYSAELGETVTKLRKLLSALEQDLESLNSRR